MRRITKFLIPSVFACLLLADFFFSGCATRSSPGGGPRDTTAPRIDTATPVNRSLFFKGQQIIIVFDEYISLKNPSQQISFSPPLAEKPQILARGKELLISWSDSLLPNTTYTVSFGESVADFTEGNVNDKIKFVFSTGSFIDSLSFKGTVMSSKDDKPNKEFLVALYDRSAIKSNDSIPFAESPTYYTYTDENGNFTLENLKYSNYHVIAFEDKRGNFKLNTGTERMAFLGESINLTDTTPAVKLRSFVPKGPRRFFGAKHIGYGQVLFPFNYPVPDLAIQPAGSAGKSLLHFNHNQDSVNYWFNSEGMDSILFYIDNGNALQDTLNVFLRPFKKPGFTIGPPVKELSFAEDIRLKSNVPIDSIKNDHIQILTSRDTLPVDSTWLINPFEIGLFIKPRPAEYTIQLLGGALINYSGTPNDSMGFKMKTLRKDDLGSVYLKIVAPSDYPLILQVFNSEATQIHSQPCKDSCEVSLLNRRPGFYNARLIVDRDSSGQWSTGDYLTEKQPEDIIYFGEKIEVRANWEMELIWYANKP